MTLQAPLRLNLPHFKSVVKTYPHPKKVWSTLLQLDIGHWFIGLFVYWFIKPPDSTMPFDKEKRSKQAQKRPRDGHGHFAPLKPKVKVSGQANLLSDLIKTEDGDDKGSSWINLTINHPFRKIIQILEDIKNKQSTKVDLKFTIPLVALPIVILMAFQFGRYQSSCVDHFSSQVGTLQNITIEKSIAPDHWLLKALSYLPFSQGIYDTKETITQSVLVNADDEGIILNNEANTDLDPFTGSKIIAFGTYNSCTKTLTLDSPQNLSNY